MERQNKSIKFFAAAQQVAAIVRQDVTGYAQSLHRLDQHRQAATDWLKRAQDMSPDDGVSYGYYLRTGRGDHSRFGWRESYVETSGYIISTFYNVAQTYSDEDASRRAERIARWLLTTQNSDGSFSNDNFAKSSGLVFDTGQVLLGLVRAAYETHDPSILAAAKQAASWLIGRLDSDGAWRKNTHNNIAHSYNARTAWALLECAQLTDNEMAKNAAISNLNWSLQQQVQAGLFKHCAFKEGHIPYTHNIAYTIRGLYEGGRILGDESLIFAAEKAAIKVMDALKPDGFLPSQIDVSGHSKSRSSCLTGSCQMAIIWLKLGRHLRRVDMIDAAKNTLGYVMRVHDIDTVSDDIRGAVKGSHPIWGRYASFAYPNWAAKFLIDALILLEVEPASS